MRFLPAFAVLLCGLFSPLSLVQADERTEFFELHVRPLLIEHCVSCHGPDAQEADIRLDSRRQVLQGSGERSALVEPGNPQQSRLLQVVRWSEDDVQMPPDGKLSADQITVLEKWIADGAAWPERGEFGAADPVSDRTWKQHWAFQPVSRPEPPVDQLTVGDHPIDAFIQETLAQHGLQPSAAASSRTLVRRLSFALTGLPPEAGDLKASGSLSDQELEEWLDTYAQRLLASPHFGERWARYWLDVARYADTKGYVFREDREYPDAWRYRQWVINSLNDDMPYDEFLSRQLAADRLAESDDPEQLAAMGFLTLGRRFLNNKHDIIDDRIDLVTRGTMGLTVTCARCHDHKYDPISQADYYALYGVFDSSDEPRDEPSPLRLVDRPEPREPVIFVRGSPANRGRKVPRRFLAMLSDGEPQPFTQGSGRLELAEQIVDPENPLTARVAVNRVWMHLFGRGLVDSPSDFGVRSDPPSHPALLDYLAGWFVEHGWSRKTLIRHIVASHTWRQSSNRRPEAEQLDPENRLLARMSRQRLDFEAHRDALLSASGRLNPAVGGPSVDITSPPFPVRRTLYARIDRQNLPGVFRTFDFASPDAHAPKRFETTVPQQALFQLNNAFVMEQAEAVASAVRGQLPEAASTDAAVQAVFQQVLQRAPTDQEFERARSFIEQQNPLWKRSPDVAGWRYGYGALSADGQRVEQFQELPLFHENTWKGAEKLPAPDIGWASVNQNGGHPGGSRSLCAIRRWTADQDCEIRIRGQLQHGNEQGDGVQGHIVVQRTGSVASGAAHSGSVPLGTESFAVKAGQDVDFVVDCRSSSAFDSFTWRVRMAQTVDGQLIRVWSSAENFSGQRPQPTPEPLAQLAQTLMMTNEFVFVD